MPKMKTHSGAKKRFRKNSAGKIKRAKAYRRHHAWARNAKTTRGLRLGGYFTHGNLKNIMKLLPY